MTLPTDKLAPSKLAELLVQLDELIDSAAIDWVGTGDYKSAALEAADFGRRTDEFKAALRAALGEQNAVPARVADGVAAIPSVDEVTAKEQSGAAPSPRHDAAHIPTDDCGFDRNGSHSAGHYVCTCGWEENVAEQEPQGSVGGGRAVSEENRPHPAPATPRHDAGATETTAVYLRRKYPDPLTDENRLLYYMEAAELYAQDCAALSADRRDAERYRHWRKHTAILVPTVTEEIIDSGLDAAMQADRALAQADKGSGG